jgi:indole-3-glycerol phosphate synthase
MKDFLEKATAKKKSDVKEAASRRPESSLRREAEERCDQRAFIERFAPSRQDPVRIVAEVKRASPSKGDIRADLDPSALAAAYEKGGASAVSVLTEPHWFKGSAQDLMAARSATSLPVLRKDFIFTSYQVYESAAIGADAVLLIAAILPGNALCELLDICASLRLDALVEVHSPEDLEAVSASRASLIGINNRNLRSLDTDTGTAVAMAARLSPGQIPVAASGIRNRSDIEKNLRAGISNFLIGEHLVRSNDPEAHLKTLKWGRGGAS